METTLKFLGDLNPWLGLLLAAGLAAAAWFLYRRETRDRQDRLSWLLPGLRALAVFLIVLALTGPILHHERVIRELGRLFVFIDGSGSMGVSDDEMPLGRKAAAMQAAGFLPRSRAFEEAEAASAHLARAQLVATRAIKAGVGDADLPQAISDFSEHLGQALEALDDFQGRASKLGAPSRGFVLAELYSGGEGRGLYDSGRRRERRGLPVARSAEYLPSFELPLSTEQDYVGWVRGFLHPPADGDYQFWLASDDQGELWISKDTDPRTIYRLANVNGYTAQREWEREGNQRSNKVRLKKGQRYYIEALLSAGSGENHLSVGWRRPGGDDIEVIGGEFLSAVGREDAGSKGAGDAGFENLQGELKDQIASLGAGAGDPFKRLEELESLRDQVIFLQERLGAAVRDSSLAYLESKRKEPEFASALDEFDRSSRLERMRRLLLDEDTGILRKIAKQQDIELIAMSNRDVETMWWQRRAGKKSSGAFPHELALGEEGYLTDLSHSINSMMEGEEEGVGVIVFSDGQHNAEGSPVEVSNVFGERGIPIFTVGYGNEAAPMDMALTEVSGPPTVFARDSVHGELLLRDSMRPGIPYRASIEHEGEIVWEQRIESDNSLLRSVEYEFPVQQLVDKITAASAEDEVERRAVALQFQVSVKPLGGELDESGQPLEKITENNSKSLFVQAVAHPKKVLIIDSRPRWETRYLHSTFSRDEQWESNILMEVFPPDQPQKSWERGDGPGMFPSSREELLTYEVIFFGDVPRRLFRDEELEWIAEFVGSRAGGLVFIDGQRNFLNGYGDSELGKLLPVVRGGSGGGQTEREAPASLALSPDGEGMEELRFASSGVENAEIWGRLRPPAWTAPVEALPGSQVLVEALAGEGQRVPVVVTRRYGGGAVLYLGTDEIWRWRYKVGDRYHQKFWVQMTNWVAEQPFSVKGKNVSIAADQMVYDPGGRATIRVRVRDDQGKALDSGDFVARLYRDGRLYSEAELEADPNQGGIFRTRTGSLEAGDYEIAVQQKYVLKSDREFGARAEFVVRAGDNRELDNLSVNRELLETVARNSGGQYFAEEEARNLVNLLESIDRKKVISSETNLWSSYWWFTAIIGLLVAEWIMRKRAGYL
ncbi:MAG: PA14 domain-containing protein [Verrucomicrobiales bacterium]